MSTNPVNSSFGTAIGGTFEEGVAALQRQDNATAIRLLLPLAQQGNAEAQFYVAIAYNTVKDYVRGAWVSQER